MMSNIWRTTLDFNTIHAQRTRQTGASGAESSQKLTLTRLWIADEPEIEIRVNGAQQEALCMIEGAAKTQTRGALGCGWMSAQGSGAKEEGEDEGEREEEASVVNLEKDAWDVDARLLSFVNNEAYAVATQSGIKSAKPDVGSQANSGSRQAHVAASIVLEEFIDEATKRTVASTRTIQREFNPQSLYFAILRYLSVQKNLEHLIDHCKGDSSTQTAAEALEPKNLSVPPRLRNYLQFLFGRDFSNRHHLLNRFLTTALEERSLIS